MIVHCEVCCLLMFFSWLPFFNGSSRDSDRRWEYFYFICTLCCQNLLCFNRPILIIKNSFWFIEALHSFRLNKHTQGCEVFPDWKAFGVDLGLTCLIFPIHMLPSTHWLLLTACNLSFFSTPSYSAHKHKPAQQSCGSQLPKIWLLLPLSNSPHTCLLTSLECWLIATCIGFFNLAKIHE